MPDIVEAAGGTALVNRVGHAFFKRRMLEEGGIFGGEVSGHYYFRDFYRADSGTLPALLVLELLSESEQTLAEMVAELRAKYFISGEINSEVADQQAKMDEIKTRFADADQREIDGISIDYPDWHFNVRSSNTEPLLRPLPRVARLRGGYGGQARRAARPHPLLTYQEWCWVACGATHPRPVTSGSLTRGAGPGLQR